MSRKSLVALVCSIALPAIAASADTLYTNVSPTYPPSSTGNVSTGATYLGVAFTPSASGSLDLLKFSARGTAPITLSLYADAGGQPGSVLESWLVTLPTVSMAGQQTVISSVLHPLLAGATQYWLLFTQTTAFQVVWNYKDTGVTGGAWAGNTLSTLHNGSSGSLMPSLTVIGAVPESGSTVMLLGAAMSAIFLLARPRADEARL